MSIDTKDSIELVPTAARDGWVVERNSAQFDSIVTGLAPLVSIGIAIAGLLIGIGSGIVLNL